MMRTLRRFVPAASLALALAACSPDTTSTNSVVAPSFSRSDAAAAGAASVQASLDAANDALAANGSPLRAAMAEFITVDGSDEAGATMLQKNVGNKQLTADFVPGDSRRSDWSTGNSITYALDETGDATPVLGGTSAADASAAIRRSINTWNVSSCGTGVLQETSSGGFDLGYVAALQGKGGSYAVAADIMEAGFRDLDFAGGVLGVTYTLIWVDDDGNPTDIDSNKKADVAFREIYYDPSWNWKIDGANIDIESVALHEFGHGMSQAHFGNIIRRNDGSFDASPRAVMNAFYQSAFRSLTGTDDAGHCSNWSAWPNN
jgi:hypothetical protein